MTKYYDKLIRDKLPSIIKKKGKAVKIEKIDDKQKYREYLKRKLLEEVNELLNKINAEDLKNDNLISHKTNNLIFVFNNLINEANSLNIKIEDPEDSNFMDYFTTDLEVEIEGNNLTVYLEDWFREFITNYYDEFEDYNLDKNRVRWRSIF